MCAKRFLLEPISAQLASREQSESINMQRTYARPSFYILSLYVGVIASLQTCLAEEKEVK